MTNYERIRQLEPYEMAMVMNNIQEHLCQKICPRDKEDRCNEEIEEYCGSAHYTIRPPRRGRETNPSVRQAEAPGH